MATAVISANISGTLDTADKRAMLHVVNNDNARRAAAVPPESQLPAGTNVDIRNSYATVQSAVLVAAHASYVAQSDIATLAAVRSQWEAATDAQRNAALAALTS